MKQRLAAPSDVIDVAKIKDLIGIEPTGAGILIKGATTHYDVANSDTVKKAIPALAYLASVIGDPAVRYRGTIGGSLATNDPKDCQVGSDVSERPEKIGDGLHRQQQRQHADRDTHGQADGGDGREE